MKRFTAREKKLDLYDVTEDLQETIEALIAEDPDFFEDTQEISEAVFMVLNVRTFEDGKLFSIETYLGIEGISFEQIAYGDHLSDPGNYFDYEDYMNRLEAELPDVFLEVLDTYGEDFYDPDADFYDDDYGFDDGNPPQGSMPEVSEEDMKTIQELLRKYGLEAELE